MPTSTAEFLAARKAVKAAIVALIQGLGTNALVLPRLIIEESPEDWAASLRSPLDLDSDGDPRVHCIQVCFRGSKQDNREDTPAGVMNPILPIGINFYRLYVIGTDADNSEDKLDDEVATVQLAIAKEEHFLGCTFDGLIVPNYRITPVISGMGRIHYGEGILEIEMQGAQLR